MFVAEIPAAVPLAKIAAQGPHIANLWTADIASRDSQGRETLAQLWMFGNGRQFCAGADDHLLRIELDADQVRDAGQADDFVGLRDVLLLEIEQVGAAGKQLDAAPTIVEES